jgi:Fe-S oxidoreductase
LAKVKLEVPELTGEITIPGLKEDAAAVVKSHNAPVKDMADLGFPTELVPDWQEKAIAKFDELLKKYRSLKVFLDICVKCGACTDKCQFYLGTKDPKNMPVARAELLRKVYRRYFTNSGKVLGKLAEAEDLTKEVLDEWFTYFHQCSECRRCSVFCPYGIDTAEITMAAREIMDTVGYGAKYPIQTINKCISVGNNLGMPGPAIQSTLDFMAEEVLEQTGVPVKFPMDVKGADVLLITPSADFFASPHVESLAGYAKVFHQAGISWTLSSYASEAGNFGMFNGNYEHMRKIAARIKVAINELKPKRLIHGECGHAWRAAYSFWNTLIGPFDSLDPKYPAPQHICDFTNDLIKRGALKLDKTANDQFVVTFHDSCNVARATRIGSYAGSQFEIPREIIRATCNKFVDMRADTIRERTYCCGAGGGLLADEIMDLRLKGVMPRMQAYKEIKDKNGANFFALICAICKAQFTKVFPYYGYDMEEVGGIHQLVGRAIVLGGKEGI